ncbi:hypothetical protein [Leptospira sp. GIMC2001]|uniref:hypothetical protein n=1 Tax=Leptospira sp. GIMC2001 TaxID=1513297 RepID=UPI00234B055B|nr:hypothetical protein [Leptospira sp. GIMC2001]WCL48876.1 hypothetical protein O4O04_16465 [Leptospira sp. GIMC2001]
MILNDLWKLNPVRLLWETTNSLPGMKSNYKVTLFLNNISHVVRKKIVDKRKDLLNLRLSSHNGEVILEGEYDPTSYFWAKFLRIRLIHYQAKLKVVSLDGNVVRFKFTSYSLDNPGRKKWDLVRFFSRFDPIHKRRILNTIVNGFPNVLRLTPIQWEVLFNLNYFLEQVPSLAGKINVVSAQPTDGTVVFQLRSGTILKPLMDLLGPQYIKIEYTGDGFMDIIS